MKIGVVVMEIVMLETMRITVAKMDGEMMIISMGQEAGAYDSS